MRSSLGAVVLFLAATAVGQDTPPPGPAPAKPAADAPADPLDVEVDAVRRLVATGLWKAGKTALDKLLASHAGDRRVVAHIAEIESDLQKCLFRLSGPQPTPVQLLGRGATKYDPASGRATFQIATLTEDTGWRGDGDVKFLDVLFDADVSVEMSLATAESTTLLLGFDSETRGAYVFQPRADKYGPQPFVYRLDPGGADPVELGHGGLFLSSRATESVRYAVTASRVVVEIVRTKNWKRDPRDVDSFADAKYRRGFVAVRGPAKLDERGLLIEGRLEPTFAKRQLAEADARRLREWVRTKWDRAAALPAWVLALEKAAGAWADKVPADCPDEARAAVVELQRAAFESRSRVRSMTPTPGLAGVVADWQTAIVAFGERRYADSEAAARKVIAAAPEFAPAHALVGRALLARGEDEASVFLFEAARRLDSAFAPAYDGLALAAFRAGDFARMQTFLSDAAAAGVGSAFTSELRQVLLRARRGPDWKKRFDCQSLSFTVSGDASFAVCSEVAQTLEEAVDVYRRQFRPRAKTTRGRVNVFSGFESYADYVSDLGGDPSGTLGMYLPTLRELCVFLHEDRPELSNTIRHEGFHQYLHDFLDDAPIWFNEGYAEFFGFSRRKQGKALVGQVGEDQAALAKAWLPKFAPLPRLFLMEPAEFMVDAGVHYVQAWAVIHLLRDTADPALKGVLDRYFDALVAGRSQREAYDEVMAGMVDKMETALKAHVAGLTTR